MVEVHASAAAIRVVMKGSLKSTLTKLPSGGFRLPQTRRHMRVRSLDMLSAVSLQLMDVATMSDIFRRYCRSGK